MIRRDAGGDFLLITQVDHAKLAGQLAGHFGNARFAGPVPREPALTAVAMHDQGWPLHDDEPTLNDRQLPLDVFEVPRSIALTVWSASTERAAAVDPYAGLLVSLHSLSLSIYATSPAPETHEKFDVQKMHEQFAVNKFQHREVERQEELRRTLGFSTTVPLKHGLAEANVSPDEDRIRFDFRLLQGMDLLSLCLCCSKLPQGETNEVLRDPKFEPVKLKLRRRPDGVLHVDPWPFDTDRIELSVPCRRVPGRRYESLEAFRAVYHSAAVETLGVVVAK
jgi:hypothetical protein